MIELSLNSGKLTSVHRKVGISGQNCHSQVVAVGNVLTRNPNNVHVAANLPNVFMAKLVIGWTRCVEKVLAYRRSPKVGPNIISFIEVAVVYVICRPRTRHIEVSQPVGVVPLAVYAYDYVATIFKPSRVTNFCARAGVDKARKQARKWVVRYKLFKAGKC
jgi:hypothetical protein